MARNRFTNPANGATYDWPLNHSDEQPTGKVRNVSNSAPTSGLGLNAQQNDASPTTLNYSGTVLRKSQLDAFWTWWQLCESQTIYFTDFAGDEYEVLITSFQPQRQRVARNPQDLANAPLWIWKYTIEMRVIRVIAGTLAGVTV